MIQHISKNVYDFLRESHKFILTLSMDLTLWNNKQVIVDLNQYSQTVTLDKSINFITL